MVMFWLIISIWVDGSPVSVDQVRQPDLQTCSGAVWQTLNAHPELAERHDKDGRRVDVTVACRITIDAEEPV
jgi:hypothetical protein